MLRENCQLRQSAERSIRVLVQSKASRENISVDELLAQFNDAIHPLRRSITASNSSSLIMTCAAKDRTGMNTSSPRITSHLVVPASPGTQESARAMEGDNEGKMLKCWLCACSSKSRYIIGNVRVCFICFRKLYYCVLLPLIDTPQRRKDVKHFLELISQLQHSSNDAHGHAAQNNNISEYDEGYGRVVAAHASPLQSGGVTRDTLTGAPTPAHLTKDSSISDIRHRHGDSGGSFDSVYDVTKPAQASFVMSASVMMRMRRESSGTVLSPLSASVPVSGAVSPAAAANRMHGPLKPTTSHTTNVTSATRMQGTAGSMQTTAMSCAAGSNNTTQHTAPHIVRATALPAAVRFATPVVEIATAGNAVGPCYAGTPVLGVVVQSRRHSNNNPGNNNTSLPVGVGSQKMWDCPRCTYINAGMLRVCEVCHYERQQAVRCEVCGMTCPVEMDLYRPCVSPSSSYAASPSEPAVAKRSTTSAPADIRAEAALTNATNSTISTLWHTISDAGTHTRAKGSGDMNNHVARGSVVSRCVDGAPHVLWFCNRCGKLHTREADQCINCYMERYWYCGFCTARHATRCDVGGLSYCTTCDSYNSTADLEQGRLVAMRETEKAVHVAAAVQSERAAAAAAAQQMTADGSVHERGMSRGSSESHNPCASSSDTQRGRDAGIIAWGAEKEEVGSVSPSSIADVHAVLDKDGSVFGVNDACTLAEQQRQQEIKDHESRLSDRLTRLHVTRNALQPDGNCLFNSISCQLFGSARQGVVVRNLIVDYMHHHREEYSMLFSKDEWMTYLQHMSAPGYWGDELCINAAARCFRVNIHVITSDAVRWHMVFRYKELGSTQAPHDKTPSSSFTTPIATVPSSPSGQTADGRVLHPLHYARPCAEGSGVGGHGSRDDDTGSRHGSSAVNLHCKEDEEEDSDTLSIFLAYLRPVHYDDICCHRVVKLSIKETFAPKLREIIQSECRRAHREASRKQYPSSLPPPPPEEEQQQQSLLQQRQQLQQPWSRTSSNVSTGTKVAPVVFAQPNTSSPLSLGNRSRIVIASPNAASSSLGTFRSQPVNSIVYSNNTILQVVDSQSRLKLQRSAPSYSSNSSSQVPSLSSLSQPTRGTCSEDSVLQRSTMPVTSELSPKLQTLDVSETFAPINTYSKLVTYSKIKPDKK